MALQASGLPLPSPAQRAASSAVTGPRRDADRVRCRISHLPQTLARVGVWTLIATIALVALACLTPALSRPPGSGVGCWLWNLT